MKGSRQNQDETKFSPHAFFSNSLAVKNPTEIQQFLALLAPSLFTLESLDFAENDQLSKPIIDKYTKEVAEEKGEIPAEFSLRLAFDFVAMDLFCFADFSPSDQKALLDFFTVLPRHINDVTQNVGYKWLPTGLVGILDTSVSYCFGVESLSGIVSSGHELVKNMLKKHEKTIFRSENFLRDKILIPTCATKKNMSRTDCLMALKFELEPDLQKVREVFYSDVVLNTVLIYFVAARDILAANIQKLINLFTQRDNESVVKKIKQEVYDYCKNYAFSLHFTPEQIDKVHFFDFAYLPAVLHAIMNDHLEAEKYLKKGITLEGEKIIFNPGFLPKDYATRRFAPKNSLQENSSLAQPMDQFGMVKFFIFLMQLSMRFKLKVGFQVERATHLQR